jgi:hypothetical protein
VVLGSLAFVDLSDRLFSSGAGFPAFSFVSVGARVRALAGGGALPWVRLRFPFIGAGNRVVEGECVLGMVPRVLLSFVLGVVPSVVLSFLHCSVS